MRALQLDAACVSWDAQPMTKPSLVRYRYCTVSSTAKDLARARFASSLYHTRTLDGMLLRSSSALRSVSTPPPSFNFCWIKGQPPFRHW